MKGLSDPNFDISEFEIEKWAENPPMRYYTEASEQKDFDVFLFSVLEKIGADSFDWIIGVGKEGIEILSEIPRSAYKYKSYYNEEFKELMTRDAFYPNPLLMLEGNPYDKRRKKICILGGEDLQLASVLYDLFDEYTWIKEKGDDPIVYAICRIGKRVTYPINHKHSPAYYIPVSIERNIEVIPDPLDDRPREVGVTIAFFSSVFGKKRIRGKYINETIEAYIDLGFSLHPKKGPFVTNEIYNNAIELWEAYNSMFNGIGNVDEVKTAIEKGMRMLNFRYFFDIYYSIIERFKGSDISPSDITFAEYVVLLTARPIRAFLYRRSIEFIPFSIYEDSHHIFHISLDLLETRDPKYAAFMCNVFRGNFPRTMYHSISKFFQTPLLPRYPVKELKCKMMKVLRILKIIDSWQILYNDVYLDIVMDRLMDKITRDVPDHSDVCLFPSGADGFAMANEIVKRIPSLSIASSFDDIPTGANVWYIVPIPTIIIDCLHELESIENRGVTSIRLIGIYNNAIGSFCNDRNMKDLGKFGEYESTFAFTEEELYDDENTVRWAKRMRAKLGEKIREYSLPIYPTAYRKANGGKK